MCEIKKRLVSFICDLAFLPEDELSADLHLFTEGYIDSVSLIDLISFIENELGRKIPAADVNLDNFDTLGKILEYAKS